MEKYDNACSDKVKEFKALLNNIGLEVIGRPGLEFEPYTLLAWLISKQIRMAEEEWNALHRFRPRKENVACREIGEEKRSHQKTARN
jgi:hypothetical protein